MDAAELRAMQAPIKERYKSDPSAAVITLKAKGSIDNEGIACKVETGRAIAGIALAGGLVLGWALALIPLESLTVVDWIKSIILVLLAFITPPIAAATRWSAPRRILVIAPGSSARSGRAANAPSDPARAG